MEVAAGSLYVSNPGGRFSAAGRLRLSDRASSPGTPAARSSGSAWSVNQMVWRRVRLRPSMVNRPEAKTVRTGVSEPAHSSMSASLSPLPLGEVTVRVFVAARDNMPARSQLARRFFRRSPGCGLSILFRMANAGGQRPQTRPPEPARRAILSGRKRQAESLYLTASVTKGEVRWG